MVKKGRLLSLDVLRGADMILLTCVGGLMRGIDAWLGPFAGLSTQTGHPYEGFTLWDMILPLFVYVSGASIPFGFGKRLDANGRPTKSFWVHLAKRFVLLWLLGMILQNGLLSLDPMKIDPYRNVLQTIAILMVVTSLLWLIKSWKIRLAVPFLVIVAVGILQAIWGDYSEAGSISWRIEVCWRTAVLPVGNIGLQPRGYNSFLVSTIVCAFVFGPAGCFTVEFLKGKNSARFKLMVLVCVGLMLMAVGWCFLPWVPSIKRMMSISFSMRALGGCFLLMAASYWLIDVLKWRRGIRIFLLYGQFSLVAYVFHSLFLRPLQTAGGIVTQGLPFWFGEASRDFWTSIGVVALQTWFLVIWSRAKSFMVSRVISGTTTAHIQQ